MADLLALAAGGLPPLGMGKYVGSVIDEAPRFAFYVVNATRTNRDAQAARVRELGADLWLFIGPDAWRPDRWRESLALIRREVRRMGAVGYIVDIENGWAALSRAARRREFAAFGAELRADAENMRVGITIFPGLPDLGDLADASGDGVFVSVQVYGRDAFTARAFSQWVERARRYFGPARTGLSIAGFVPSTRPEMGTRAGYAQYMSMLPDSPSNIVWGLGSLPPHMVEALSRRDVGGTLAGSAAWGALALVARPAGVVSIIVVALVVAVVVFAARRSAA